MKILHILSQTQPTGAESYALTLAEWQLRQGHDVFVVSDRLHFPTQAKVFYQPIHNRKYLQRIKNIRFVKRLIKENKIEVVHSHSRAASWISFYSCLRKKIPLISTIHGRQHIHPSSRWFDIYGDRIIAICKNIEVHLKNELMINQSKIKTIPNAVHFETLDRVNSSSSQTHRVNLAIAGRTTGPKGERTSELLSLVIPSLLEQFKELHVEVLGGKMEDLPNGAQHNVYELLNNFPNRFKFLGFLNEEQMYQTLCRQNIVIASGRIAISSLYFGKTVLAMGEALTHGVVTSKNLSLAVESNFGDIACKKNTPPPDILTIHKELEEFLKCVQSPSNLKNQISQYYNANQIAEKVFVEYYSALAKKNYTSHIPILMYHRVTDEPLKSKHRIFVTKETFQKHLDFLKKNRFTPITFRQYDMFRSGLMDWNQFPKRPVILTLDDAYEDNYINAFPLLNKFGFNAVIFALGNESMTYNEWDVKTGESRVPLMTRSQMCEMSKAGIEFGAHSLTHRHLTKLPSEEVFKELLESKINLENLLGVPVIAFAYPYGDYNETVKDLTQQAGYKFGVATDSGGLHLEDDPFAIFRVSIFPEDQTFKFLKKTSSWYRKYYYLRRRK